MAHITSKELMGLGDQLAVEQNLVAKFKAYAAVTEDTALKSKYEQIAQKHQRHYDELFANVK